MAEGPTDEQLTEVWQAILHVQKLASDPSLAQRPQLLEDALSAAYEVSHTFAMIGIVSYAGGRFEALRELARTSPFGEATITFPRQALLAARPPSAPVAVYEQCLDLVEAEALGAEITELVEALNESAGLEGFKLLALVCAVLGRMVVERDPSLQSMEQLLAREMAG